MIEVVWEYRVREDRREEFERAYRGGGRWSRLFSRDPAYAGTLLLRDVLDPLRYATRDRWASRAQYDAFLHRHAAEYREVDRECEGLTAEEHPAGVYEIVPETP